MLSCKPANTHHSLPSVLCLAMQADGPRGWTKDLAIKCSNLVLKSCIVGLYMPPLRQSLLRVMHNTSHIEEECVYEHCK